MLFSVALTVATWPYSTQTSSPLSLCARRCSAPNVRTMRGRVRLVFAGLEGPQSVGPICRRSPLSNCHAWAVLTGS
jgi:hypothetical protein